MLTVPNQQGFRTTEEVLGFTTPTNVTCAVRFLGRLCVYAVCVLSAHVIPGAIGRIRLKHVRRHSCPARRGFVDPVEIAIEQVCAFKVLRCERSHETQEILQQVSCDGREMGVRCGCCERKTIYFRQFSIKEDFV